VGVEHTWVSRREENRPAQLPPDWTPPVQDEMHVHRLQLEYADLYERLERLSDVPPVFRERVIFPLRNCEEITRAFDRSAGYGSGGAAVRV
jgi:hypothetical protein